MVPIGRLPDSHSIFRCDVHLIARLHIERFVKRVHIGKNPVAAILARRVGICIKSTAQFFVTIQSSPDLCPPVEESLIAGKAIDLRRRFVAK